MRPKIFFSIVSLFIFNFCVSAQQKEFEFKNFTQEDGLPSNESYFVYRDSKEFLWIATDKGVVRYGGNKMENYDLPDNVVFKIREDSKGKIWFFSHTGKLAYFFNGTIYPYKYNENILKTIKNLVITDAYVDSDDNIIINSALGSNYKISKSGVIEKFNYYKQTFPDTVKIAIKPIGRNKYFSQVRSFAATPLGVPFLFSVENNKQTSHFQIPLYQIPLTLSGFPQYGAITINNKDIFFFIDNCIVKLNENGAFQIKKFPSSVLCMHGDNKGNIWVGLQKAGAVLMNQDLKEIYFPAALINKSISSVTQDYEGGTWFSTLEKGVYFLKNIRVGHFIPDNSMPTEVFRLLNVNDSVLMYANEKGLYSLTNSKITCLQNIENARTSDLITNAKGDIFLGVKASKKIIEGVHAKKMNNVNLVIIPSSSEIVQPFNNKFIWSSSIYLSSMDLSSYSIQKLISKKSHLPAYTLIAPGIVFLDQSKQVWTGTLNNLYRVNSTTGVQIAFKDSFRLFKKGITCMRQMKNGIYTIGIRFGGIAIMKDTEVISTITESDGLLSNSIKYLLPLENQLWAATSKGISVIQFKSYNPLVYTITNIGKNEGFYNIIVNQLLQYRGNILAATSNGIYFIEKPGEILNEKPRPIPFYINTVSYYKGDISNVNSISVPYSRNRVSIKYAALCYNAHDEIRYFYRFDTSDTTWQSTNSTELLLENLSPGKYTLELKAAISNYRRFSTIQKLQIIVEKPWWQNNWLRLIGVFFLTGAVYLFYKRRIHLITLKEKQKANLNNRMLELEQTALRAQMNPHFIFNCLTSIQQLIISGNKTAANEYLVKFARLIRKTLTLSGNSFITIEEETDYIREYLVLEQLRIPEQFEFSINIDSDINIYKTQIPAMMLQPIIENSIRHGIRHLENKNGHINISLKRKGAYIVCSVTDNGVGRTKSGESKESSFRENKSYGMDIVAKRLSTIFFHHENEAKLDIEDLLNIDGSPAGTKVTMQLPFKT